MRKTLLLSLLLWGTLCFSQEVISSSGESYSNAEGQLDFTVGEVIIATESNSENILTQGFHQTDWNFVGLEDHVVDYEAIVYPNPMMESLNIKTSAYDNVSYELYDGRGRLVATSRLEGELTPIDVSTYLPGSYNLRLMDANAQPLKTFKLVKHQ